jgi:formate dehydrogenase iron-sulfur subunit
MAAGPACAALAKDGAAVVDEVLQSGLRGRGGAAFPAGIKWKTVRAAKAGQKYVVCNADEGDSGTYSDRMTMEGDPFMLIEGMAIAALAVGATQGYVYIRSEYPHAIGVINEAIARAEAAGYLGPNVCASGQAFHLHVRKAAGSYVCGEETAMLESIEGKRGIVRAKPPLPAMEGLFGQPTVINNVITFASVPIILARARRSTGLWHGPIHRHIADPAGGQHQAGWLVEKAFGVTCANSCLTTAAAAARAARSRRCRWAGRWAPTCRSRNGTCRWTTKPMPPWARWWATVASWCMTTRPTWRSWRAMPWSSVPSNRAANARPAALVPPAAWR